MNERKKRPTAAIIWTVILALAAGLLCYLASGPESITPPAFRFGLYAVSDSAPAGLPDSMGGSLLVTDRRIQPGTVSYSFRGRSERVLCWVSDVGRVLTRLHDYRLAVWVGCALFGVLCVVLWLTAPRRRIRRMQMQMRKTFAECGARFDAEDAGKSF